MTAVPGSISGTGTSLTYAAKVGPCIAPLMTHGAIRVPCVNSDDQSLSSPTAEWCGCGQTPAAQEAAPQAVEVDFDGGLVDEDGALRHGAYCGHAMARPVRPHSVTFARLRSSAKRLFFERIVQSLWVLDQSRETDARTPWAWSNAPCTSFNAMSES